MNPEGSCRQQGVASGPIGYKRRRVTSLSTMIQRHTKVINMHHTNRIPCSVSSFRFWQNHDTRTLVNIPTNPPFLRLHRSLQSKEPCSKSQAAATHIASWVTKIKFTKRWKMTMSFSSQLRCGRTEDVAWI